MRPQPSLTGSLLGSFTIIVCTFIAYSPAIRDGFIWDDDSYITNNVTLTKPNALAQVWLDPHASPQCYPVTFSFLYLERLLWGQNPTGFHLVGISLHACNAALVWFVLRRLEVPEAYLAAALFALHPVEVETVAWATEQKNTLSGLLALVSLLSYLRFQPLHGGSTPEPPRHTRYGWYGLSLGLFVLALLAKSVVATLSGVLLLLLWWKRPSLRPREVVGLAPFFAVGAVLGLNTARLEISHVGANGPDFNLTFLDRLLISSRAVCFYASKLLLPARLTFFYPRWQIDPGQPLHWIPVLTIASSIVVLYLLRHRLGRGPLTAVLCFTVILFPALGFMHIYPARQSFVADHFQYHASIALLALFGAVAARLCHRPLLGAGVILPILVLLGSITWSRCLVYRDAMTLWTDTLEKNPNAWVAHTNLANLFRDQGRLEKALEHHNKTIELKPNELLGYLNLGDTFLRLGDVRRAIDTYERGLSRLTDKPDDLSTLEHNIGFVW
jgi:hypothetical protein